MFEVINLVCFAVVCYLLLIGVPSIVEQVSSEEFKNAYVNAKKEDIKIIKSPVGMPGRAIYNEFIKDTEKNKSKIQRCYGCIRTCNGVDAPYCITKALVNAVKGNINEALVFCGSNVDKIKEIVTVKELMQELTV